MSLFLEISTTSYRPMRRYMVPALALAGATTAALEINGDPWHYTNYPLVFIWLFPIYSFLYKKSSKIQEVAWWLYGTMTWFFGLACLYKGKETTLMIVFSVICFFWMCLELALRTLDPESEEYKKKEELQFKLREAALKAEEAEDDDDEFESESEFHRHRDTDAVPIVGINEKVSESASMKPSSDTSKQEKKPANHHSTPSEDAVASANPSNGFADASDEVPDFDEDVLGDNLSDHK